MYWWSTERKGAGLKNPTYSACLRLCAFAFKRVIKGPNKRKGAKPQRCRARSQFSVDYHPFRLHFKASESATKIENPRISFETSTQFVRKRLPPINKSINRITVQHSSAVHR
jgi:hypothetical protein